MHPLLAVVDFQRYKVVIYFEDHYIAEVVDRETGGVLVSAYGGKVRYALDALVRKYNAVSSRNRQNR